MDQIHQEHRDSVDREFESYEIDKRNEREEKRSKRQTDFLDERQKWSQDFIDRENEYDQKRIEKLFGFGEAQRGRTVPAQRHRPIEARAIADMATRAPGDLDPQPDDPAPRRRIEARRFLHRRSCDGGGRR